MTGSVGLCGAPGFPDRVKRPRRAAVSPRAMLSCPTNVDTLPRRPLLSLFPGGAAAANNYLVSFKAGKCTRADDSNMVTAQKQKGLVFVEKDQQGAYLLILRGLLACPACSNAHRPTPRSQPGSHTSTSFKGRCLLSDGAGWSGPQCYLQLITSLTAMGVPR